MAVMTDEKKDSKRPGKTSQELRDASDALYYEIWMFNEMVESLLTQPAQPGNPEYNALVESFVQHMRNLIGFFYPSSNVYEDTIIAADFFPDPNQWNKKISKWLDKERKDAHKFLAHLTYSRIGSKKRWDYPKISKHMNAVFDKFYERVPQYRIGKKLKDYKGPSSNSDTLVDTTASTSDVIFPARIVPACRPTKLRRTCKK
jgi:hypothetical protein